MLVVAIFARDDFHIAGWIGGLGSRIGCHSTQLMHELLGIMNYYKIMEKNEMTWKGPIFDLKEKKYVLKLYFSLKSTFTHQACLSRYEDNGELD